ncbi:uncharacterized protein LOC143303381 [Bombus vancouverensis nearcticus]|uniref:uncharacterized protein LOC143303381 n=1 Tax=Bombus vancouverensis nearcticus TaxID=2705178 RepID=UPI00402BC5D1
MDYLHSLIAEMPQSVSGPSTTKTPKVLKKKGHHQQNTRAAAQTEASENANIAEKAIANKLARKLIAKAKKILLAKQNKDVDERRKQEEQQRLQRLQEQEKAERILAEQRRREQKAEKRKDAELRAQRQAADEAMKTKHQIITSQPKYGSKQQGPTTYVLDGELDNDESGHESRPKHTVTFLFGSFWLCCR